MNAGRRGFILGASSLIVPFLLPPAPAWAADAAKQVPAPDQLDSYLAIDTGGGITVFFGKIDGGQGLDVAIGQVVAEELDVTPGQVRVVMGDTALTVNQGGASNASGVSQGAVPLRNAAAEARRLLLELASKALGERPSRLMVRGGVVSVIDRPEYKRSYGELVGGRPLENAVKWNGRYGNDLNVTGRATPKPVSAYTVVGTAQPRRDIPAKAFGRHEFVTNVRLPGMLHARMVRPPIAGAVATAVDRGSVRGIPGVVVVHKGGLVAVLAPREWDAIRALGQVAVTWTDPPGPFPDQATLYDHIRAAPVVKRGVPQDSTAVESAFSTASRTLQAEYRWPFQSHSSMGPACALADVRADGFTIWTGSQKPHAVRDGVAAMLGVPQATGRAIWRTGPGSYGRNDAGDAAMDAALLSREVGRPVRVQYMRNEGHAWDPKSPASIQSLRGGLDADGRITALELTSKSFSRLDTASSEADPRDTLASQLMGGAPHFTPAYLFPGESLPLEAYGIDAKQVAWEVIPPFLASASPLRTSHLRDPLGPELVFASECFIDELAAAAGSDALAFRLRHLPNTRDAAVLNVAATAAGWQARPSGPRAGADATRATGRGIALAHRDGTFVATVAEVSVDRTTGSMRIDKLSVAHDCGLVINPGGLRRCIENAVTYAASRALHEEVVFSHDAVTSVDWLTYPILDITETPDAIDVVLINRPEISPTGAGEPSVRSVPAAIANAVFDATGVRLRQGPFTPARLLAALSA